MTAKMLWISTLMFFSQASVLVGQEQFDVYIEKESAAFVVIEDPESLVDYFRSSQLLENRNFEAALEILRDERFSLASVVAIEETLTKFNYLLDAIRQIDQVTIVIHELKKSKNSQADSIGIPDFSIIFTTKEESVAGLKEAATDFMKRTVESGDSEWEDAFVGTLNQFQIIKAGNSVIVTNAPASATAMVQRGENKPAKFRSLARNRSYQSIQALLNKKERFPTIRGYINPSHSGVLITGVIDEMFARFPPNSLAGAGFNIVLNGDDSSLKTPEGEFQATMEFDAVVRYVRPALGFGELIEALRPIEILPTKPFKVSRLSAVGFSGIDRSNARQKMYEKKTRPVSWNEMILRGYQGSELAAETVLGHAKVEIQLYHFPEAINLPRFLAIKTPDDKAKMNEVFMHTVKDENRNNRASVHLTKSDCEYGIRFARSNAAIRENLESHEPEKKNKGTLSNEILARQREYFLNDEWMVYSDPFSLNQLIDGLYRNPADDGKFETIFQDAVDDSQAEEFVKIVYESSSWNLVKAAMIEGGYITKKYKSHEKQQELLTAEPDQFGLRVPLDTAEDAKLAVNVLLARSLAETFGTSIQLYSKGENRLQLYGKVYSLVK